MLDLIMKTEIRNKIAFVTNMGFIDGLKKCISASYEKRVFEVKKENCESIGDYAELYVLGRISRNDLKELEAFCTGAIRIFFY